MAILQLPPLTITDEELVDFSDQKGYQEFDADGVTPNPKTREEFIIEWMIRKNLEIILEGAFNAIDVYYNSEREVAKENKRQEWMSRIS